MLSLTLIAIPIILIILGLIWFFTHKRRDTEPVIELEKLTHCKACGSLIPEGASRCAFCGKTQIEKKPTTDQ